MSIQTSALTVVFLMVVCPLKLTFCRSFDDRFEIDAFDEVVESRTAAKTSRQQSDGSKRAPSNDESQIIRNQCFSGDFQATVKALGVLDLPGVRLVRVEGELYAKLLQNGTVVQKKSNPSNPDNKSAASDASSKVSIVKRSSYELCKEEYYDTFILTHASGQLAFQMDTIVCQSSNCESPGIEALAQGEFGDCILETKPMVVYIVNAYGNIVSQTINIGCACKCFAYL